MVVPSVLTYEAPCGCIFLPNLGSWLLRRDIVVWAVRSVDVHCSYRFKPSCAKITLVIEFFCAVKASFSVTVCFFCCWTCCERVLSILICMSAVCFIFGRICQCCQSCLCLCRLSWFLPSLRRRRSQASWLPARSSPHSTPVPVLSYRYVWINWSSAKMNSTGETMSPWTTPLEMSNNSEKTLVSNRKKSWLWETMIVRGSAG